MNLSVTRLREDGTKEWDLPSLGRRPHRYNFDDDESDGDSADDSSSDDGSSGEGSPDSITPSTSPDEDSSDISSSESGRIHDDTAPDHVERSVLGVGGGVGFEQRSLRLEPDWFVVFPLELSNPCSLVVGKIVSVNSSGGGGGDVSVHWYTPARKQKCRRSKYGKGVWSKQFVIEGGRRVPNMGTESIDSACFTFPSLLQSGKLPTGVWAAVEDSIPTTSLVEESESEGEDENEEEESGAGSAGAPHSSDAEGLPSAPVEPRLPSPASPPPPTVAAPLPCPSTKREIDFGSLQTAQRSTDGELVRVYCILFGCFLVCTVTLMIQ